MAEGLSNNGMTDKHRWLLANDGSFSQEYQLRSIGSEAQLVKWFLYGLTLWLLKGSLLYFFSGRLTVSTAPILGCSYRDFDMSFLFTRKHFATQRSESN